MQMKWHVCLFFSDMLVSARVLGGSMSSGLELMLSRSKLVKVLSMRSWSKDWRPLIFQATYFHHPWWSVDASLLDAEMIGCIVSRSPRSFKWILLEFWGDLICLPVWPTSCLLRRAFSYWQGIRRSTVQDMICPNVSGLIIGQSI